jgi:eukaryotic-like serine/threonine-protein kinase
MDLPGYRLIEHLSRTRRFDTYEVWSEDRACSCVAKVVRDDRVGEAHVRHALIEEGTRLLGLVHPHIVRGYELIAEPQPALIMETLDGETLAHLIERTPGGLPPEDVGWLGIHLASALRYLHRRGLLHLDVKPGNVVAEAGRAKLLDLSTALPPGRYEPGVGTWCYLSPEQDRGDELGPAADVWGLGITLYEAATGDDVEGRPPSAHGRTDDRLAATIDACLQPDPAARPSLDELMLRLEPVAHAADGLEAL